MLRLSPAKLRINYESVIRKHTYFFKKKGLNRATTLEGSSIVCPERLLGQARELHVGVFKRKLEAEFARGHEAHLEATDVFGRELFFGSRA